MEKSECGAMVRFVRVTYVRRAAAFDDSTETPSTTTATAPPPSGDYLPPKGFSYKTFVPSPVKVAMCSGAPVYESFASTWERARVWLRLVGQTTFIALKNAHLQILTRSHPVMVGDMSRVTLNFDLSIGLIPSVHF